MTKVFQHMVARIAESNGGNHIMTCLEKTVPKRANVLQIVTYHQIHNPMGFEEQMAYLKANYRVISVIDVLEVVEGGKALPPSSLLITFDDAYRNFADCAWPILKKYRLPVTLFVPTAFPDCPDKVFWWERLNHGFNRTPRRDVLTTSIGELPLKTKTQRERAFKLVREHAKTLPHPQTLTWVDQICRDLDAPPPTEQYVLSWSDLRQLAREGVTLGAHTQNHPLLNRILPEEVEGEVVGSLRDLEREIGSALPILAYPAGGFNDEVVKCLTQVGFILAFTTVRGTNYLEQGNPLRLKRNNIGPQATLPVLRARLLQASIGFNQWQSLNGH